ASSCCVTCGRLTQLACSRAPEMRWIRDSGRSSISPNLAKSTSRTLGRPAPGTAPRTASFTNAFTSSARIRPFTPVPRTRPRSTPSSRASLRTEGLACARANAVSSIACGGADTAGDGLALASAGPPLGAGVGRGGGVSGLGAAAASARSRDAGDSACAPASSPCAPAASAGFSSRISSPVETRSPALTFNATTTPGSGAGTSIDAFSVSSVMRPCSASTSSPSATSTSMTSTSAKSPRSGTTTGRGCASPPLPPDPRDAGFAGSGGAAEASPEAADGSDGERAPAVCEAAGSAAAPASSPSTTISTSPVETRSPTETLISLTEPAAGDGTSTVAFSVSRLTSGSSGDTRSPTLTRMSVISTSDTSPRSGTEISTSVRPQLDRHRIGLLRIDAELPDRTFHHLVLDGAAVGERRQRGDDDRMPIHPEELPQRLAPVASAVSVLAERHVPAGHPLANLGRHGLHVIRRRDERPLAAAQTLRDIARARLLERMQLVPALHREGLAAQLAEARDAEDVRIDLEPLVEDPRGRLHLTQNRAGAHQLHARTALLALAAVLEQIHPLQDALRGAFGHRGVHVVLVHAGDVIEDVLLLGEHPPHAVLDDHGELVRVAGVVSMAVRHRRRDELTVAVLVLKPLARERRPPGRAADQETARLHVAAGPAAIPAPLEAEHRIEEIERDHLHAVIAVRRAGRGPGTERARLVDAFLQDLALLVLAVVRELIGVLRRVELTERRINADLAEHALHAERARLVRHDRHHAGTDLLVTEQRGQHPHERHRR